MLADGLARRGHQVVVFTHDPKPLQAAYDVPAPSLEGVRRHQPLADRRLRRHHDRRQRFKLALLKVDTSQRPIDLKRTRLAGLRIDVIPVVEAKRDVAVFLDFEHQNAVAERVDDAGGDQNALRRARARSWPNDRSTVCWDREAKSAALVPGFSPA